MISPKVILRKSLNFLGYQIQKGPSVEYLTIPVFDVCAQLLMQSRGDALSFIQVGANNGRWGDPIRRYVFDHGWAGVLIEPQPEVFDELRKNYASAPNLIFENTAIAAGSETITMYRGNTGDYPITTLHKSVINRSAPYNVEQIIVSCATLNSLVEKHGLTSVDVLQIDAEGHDSEVLLTLDLARIPPMLIQFEHGMLTPKQINSAVSYLRDYGYRILYGGYQSDTVAIHSAFPLLVSQPTAQFMSPDQIAQTKLNWAR